MENLEQHSLWHLAFFSQLAARSQVRADVLKATKQDNVTAAVAYSASLLEALGYDKAGNELHRFLQEFSPTRDNTKASSEEEQPQSWLSILSTHVRQHAEQFVSQKFDSSSTLAAVLRETQQQYANTKGQGKDFVTLSSCDALFAALTADYLQHTSSGQEGISHESNRDLSLFQLVPPSASLSSSSAPASAGTAAERNADARQQRQWYEARLYGALACSASMPTPGPLARLLVAYAYMHDSRLQAVVDDNLLARVRGHHPDNEQAGTLRNAAAEADEQNAAAAAQAWVRLSGIVAGVLEYALYVAQVRSSAIAATLNATVEFLSSRAETSPVSKPPESQKLIGFSKVLQSAALLFVQVTEECGYYQQALPVAAKSGAQNNVAGESSATTAATAVVHAVQELLFTIVLGGGTVSMLNRPQPITPKKRSAFVETGMPLLVVTTRGVSLPEADAITQELFPILLQQLGMEWMWSPLSRHLASLDKQQQPPPLPPSASPPETFHRCQLNLPVRWSSHMLIDTALLSVARKTYPQRLLNILPGSYERFLQNLDLLPPTRPQGEDGNEETAVGTATQASLFDMPLYYKEPATALVSYFQRAGTSGLRLEEVSRILTTATNSYPMVVRLKAQAPPLNEADEQGEGDGEDEEYSEEQAMSRGKYKKSAVTGFLSSSSTSHTYALSRERVCHLVARYKGEVLLAAVVVYTQLRIPSQVQQLMRALAPLFLAIHLDWRTHHDGSIAAWILQQQHQRGNGGVNDSCSLKFSNEAAVLLDKVGYEFYPLEWLPAVATTSLSPSSSTVSSINTLNGAPLPYSLCAAVGHQFRLQLRGAPLGSSGDATLRHPAGPRTSVVIPSAGTTSLFPSREESAVEIVESTAAAWRRAERFFTCLMQVCYLDSKTSSTELEGTLAVSSTRRVLTTSDVTARGSYVGSVSAGGALLIAPADIASQRLHALLQQPAIMDAMWGSMDAFGTAGTAKSGSRGQQQQQYHQRRQKRARAPAALPETERAEAVEQLRTMRQLLLDYGASSFDTTVEAADFALTVAQSFLPTTAGMSATLSNSAGAASAPRRTNSDLLLQRALEWSRAVVGASASKARINMLLQQQQQQQQQNGVAVPSVPSYMSLVNAYNSATVDMAWMARSTLRHVPRRILEKINIQQTQVNTLAQRETTWLSRLSGFFGAAAVSAAPDHAVAKEATGTTPERIDPLLLEQWTQYVRVWQQLGLVDAVAKGGSRNDNSHESPLSNSHGLTSADEMSCVQWLWYSPYFSAEWVS